MKKIFNICCWLVLVATLFLVMLDIVPPSRYVNITIILALFFSIVSLSIRNNKVVYIITTPTSLGIFSTRASADACAKENETWALPFSLDSIISMDEK